MTSGVGLPIQRNRLGFGPISLGRLVACEVLILAAFMSWMFPPPVPYAVSALCGMAAVAVVVLGYRGLGHRLALRIRRRRVRNGTAGKADIGADPLSALVPDLGITGVSERETTYGVAFDGRGWFIGIMLRADDPTIPIGLDASILTATSQVLLDPAITISAVQIVSHQVPAPSVELEPDCAAIESYRELLGDDPVVSHHTTWIAVRLDVADAMAVAEERGGGVQGAQRAVIAVAGRLMKRLTDARVSHRVLGADGLRVALTHSVTGETISASLARRAGEEWQVWRVGPQVNVTFGIDGRVREIDSLRRLWASMALVSVSFSTVSLTLRPWRRNPTSDPQLTVQSLLRVSYDDDVDEGAAEQLVATAADCGVRLWRYDGEQAAATYASAPTGGGLGQRYATHLST